MKKLPLNAEDKKRIESGNTAAVGTDLYLIGDTITHTRPDDDKGHIQLNMWPSAEGTLVQPVVDGMKPWGEPYKFEGLVDPSPIRDHFHDRNAPKDDGVHDPKVIEHEAPAEATADSGGSDSGSDSSSGGGE